MASKTVLTCDRCGDSWDASDRSSPSGAVRQLWNVSVVAQEQGSRNTYGLGSVSKTIEVQWCRPCMNLLDALGHALKAPAPKQAPAIPPPTPFETIERILREIAREEAEQAVEKTRGRP